MPLLDDLRIEGAVPVAGHGYPGARYGILSGFEPGTRTLEAHFQIAPPFKPLPVDIVLDKDVPVTLRDGVTIHVDVFRPAGAEKVPVIVAWSPYGKGQGTSASVMGIFGMVGLDNGIVSGLAKFEGPDPKYWCAQGYAICTPGIRGVVDSEGDSVVWDRQEGRDCYDLIEWLGVQDWCTGKVGMSATSYLAVSQWFTAVEQPPHLAAINPWEGVSDVYRDLVLRGGMPDTGFAEQLQNNSYWGRGQREEWLRIHNSQEWPDYCDEANTEDLRRFFDHFLKGEDNGWDQTPRVRYSLLDLEGGDRVNIPADQFPPADVQLTRYHLDGRSRTLGTTAPADEATAGYTVGANPDVVSFVTRFDQETTLVGYPKAHLWVEAKGHDDMDLFILVQKLDAYGTPLQQFTVPNQGALIQDVTERGASILRYKRSDGRLRVSMRHLDEKLSTEAIPAHSFDRVEKLSPGEVVDVEIDLLPVGLTFYPGEQLRLVISGRSLLGTTMPGNREHTPANKGQHIVHTGGERASYLQIPVKPA
ncbi:CocE/NonD family hydrolase [Streptomyces sp. NPDC052015]|uniref:CocE/NonD family hydrolase n=1 Tax=Streptomyces sp. NPDC052015 TaxID=3154755 RepID=UPI00341B00CD